MTPKEKAKELYDWFSNEGKHSFNRYQSSEKEDSEGAKFCALKTVDEILDAIRVELYVDSSSDEVLSFVVRRIKYYKEVKQELEKL